MKCASVAISIGVVIAVLLVSASNANLLEDVDPHVHVSPELQIEAVRGLIGRLIGHDVVHKFILEIPQG